MAQQIVADNFETSLKCSFSHPSVDPEKIILDLAPNGVTWTYMLNSNVIDTYGGQVVQILGVSVQSLEIKGQFGGIDPHWGVFNNARGREIGDGPAFTGKSRWSEGGRYTWRNDPEFTNGIRQMADWFRQYFVNSTQGVGDYKAFNNYDERVMVFEFPGRNWKIPIRPTAFPQVKISNEEIAPEWVVQADFVESFESSRAFLDDISTVARERLAGLKNGIGFQKVNPFSEYTNVNRLDQLATGIVRNYQDSVLNGLSEDEINELISLGFSYPPGVYRRAGENG